MLLKIKRDLRENLKNIPGFRTRRKILIIEADDWGSIRMPSKKVYDSLKRNNPALLGKSRFNKYDTIESAEDLDKLFRVLNSFKDKNGTPARLTPFCNLANPDFERIKASNFKEYFYKTYCETITHYNRSHAIFDLWQEGINTGIFYPQYHGREHLTVPLFMRLLRAQNQDLITGFDKEFCHPQISELNPALRSLRPGFFFDNWDEFNWLENALADGVNLFEQTFKIKPTVFCPSNGFFHDKFKPQLVKNNIKTTVESGKRFIPDGNGSFSNKYYINGKKDKLGIITYGRNCRFEPLEDGINRSINNALRQVKVSFRWGKPAILATHRVNFVGGLSSENRQKGLGALSQLLKELLESYPDIEFMNSLEYSQYLHKSMH